jgi:hypothetical protein
MNQIMHRICVIRLHGRPKMLHTPEYKATWLKKHNCFPSAV